MVLCGVCHIPPMFLTRHNEEFVKYITCKPILSTLLKKLISQAFVNIPALSESTLRRDIAASDISLDSNIQVNIIIDVSKQPCACM